MYQKVIEFWFEEIDPKMWWASDKEFDQQILRRFGDFLVEASQGELHHWRSEPKGRLAEIIVLDQFSRNIFRNTPYAFANDTTALVLAQEAVSLGIPDHLSKTECAFLLLPYMHSESKKIHQLAEPLFLNYTETNNYEFELKHKEIIDRFGRYPHRNQTLNRQSTSEEIAFLELPNSSF